jgi:hypothetical protein
LAKKEKKAKPHKIPRQAPLPGIGDTKIAAIENAAMDYAEIRDSRQELTKQEVDLKGKLLKLMHAKNLTEYKRNGISVKVQVEEETVKVRVRAEEDGEPSRGSCGGFRAGRDGAGLTVATPWKRQRLRKKCLIFSIQSSMSIEPPQAFWFPP